MSVYKIILFTFYLAVSQCRVPDKVLCVNKDCSGECGFRLSSEISVDLLSHLLLW